MTSMKLGSITKFFKKFSGFRNLTYDKALAEYYRVEYGIRQQPVYVKADIDPSKKVVAKDSNRWLYRRESRR